MEDQIIWGSTDQPQPWLPAQHWDQPGAAMGFHESVPWGEGFPFATLLLPHRVTLPSPEIQETFGTQHVPIPGETG